MNILDKLDTRPAFWGGRRVFTRSFADILNKSCIIEQAGQQWAEDVVGSWSRSSTQFTRCPAFEIENVCVVYSQVEQNWQESQHYESKGGHQQHEYGIKDYQCRCECVGSRGGSREQFKVRRGGMGSFGEIFRYT